MKTEIINVTPEIARQMLDRNHREQRNVMTNHVEHLAQQMASGQWMLNGEPLILDTEGNLLDGQHRLLAILQSKTPCRMLVVRGADAAVFATINSGRGRTPGNVMAIHGVQNANAAAATVSGVMNYEAALKRHRKDPSAGSLNSSMRPSRQDMINEYNKRPQAYNHAVQLGRHCQKQVAPSIISTAAALALIHSSKPPSLVEEFFDKVSKGLNLSEDDPVFKLREKLQQDARATAKMGRVRMLLLVVKAWNLYAQGKSCYRLTVSSNNVFEIE